MRYIIDRFEGNFAVCEAPDRTMATIERAVLPQDAAEGDILTFENGEYVLLKEETQKRREAIRKKMDALWE